MLGQKDDGGPMPPASGGTDGDAPDKKDIPLLVTIFRLYLQQEYMYKNHVHSVTNRIVSIDSEGYGRIEKVSFDAYNESGSLNTAYIGCVIRICVESVQDPETDSRCHF